MCNKKNILYKKNSKYEIVKYGDTSMLICKNDSKKSIILNDTAQLLLSYLEKPASEEKIIDLIVKEYKIDKQQATKDIKNFISQMLNISVINAET